MQKLHGENQPHWYKTYIQRLRLRIFRVQISRSGASYHSPLQHCPACGPLSRNNRTVKMQRVSDQVQTEISREVSFVIFVHSPHWSRGVENLRFNGSSIRRLRAWSIQDGKRCGHSYPKWLLSDCNARTDSFDHQNSRPRTELTSYLRPYPNE